MSRIDLGFIYHVKDPKNRMLARCEYCDCSAPLRKHEEYFVCELCLRSRLYAVDQLEPGYWMAVIQIRISNTMLDHQDPERWLMKQDTAGFRLPVPEKYKDKEAIKCISTSYY